MKSGRRVCGTQTMPATAWSVPFTLNDLKRNSTKEEKHVGPPDSRTVHSWPEFLGLSTCAAVTHFGGFNRQPPLVRFIWIVTLAFGIVSAAYSTYQSFLSFFRAAATSEMLIEKAPGSRLELPKFHICTTNAFNVSVLNGILLVVSTVISSSRVE